MAEENLIYEQDISRPCLNMSRTREKDHPAVKGGNKLQREVTTGEEWYEGRRLSAFRR